MAVAGRGSGAAGAEFMDDFILLRRKTAARGRTAGCGYFATVCHAR
jgi:hypothetical protein